MANKKKIVLRRGPGIDLPGKPREISPKEWNDSLDEGELAFSSDTGRIFVGPNPESTLPQSRRLQYPYKNIELVGEISYEVVARMHGDRMREGDNRDYHVATLPSGLVDLQPVSYIQATVIISADIESFNGRRLKTIAVYDGSEPFQTPTDRIQRDKTPARYWQFKSGLLGGGSSLYPFSYLYFRELGFHETIGGPNIINQATIISEEGALQSSVGYLAGDLPQYAVDGNSNTLYYGRRPAANTDYPLHFSPMGIIFDFGAGNDKWLTEASVIYGGFYETRESKLVQVEIMFSHDKLNWTRAYRVDSTWPTEGQLRYLPERIDPIPNNLTRNINLYAQRQSGATSVKLTAVSLHAVVNGPALPIFAVKQGTTNRNPQVAYDGDIATEWTDTIDLEADFRLITKSTVAEIRITGPQNPAEAPVSIRFKWWDTAYIFTEDGTLLADNLTWTSYEVKTFLITIVNNELFDANQIPLGYKD